MKMPTNMPKGSPGMARRFGELGASDSFCGNEDSTVGGLRDRLRSAYAEIERLTTELAEKNARIDELMSRGVAYPVLPTQTVPTVFTKPLVGEALKGAGLEILAEAEAKAAHLAEPKKKVSRTTEWRRKKKRDGEAK